MANIRTISADSHIVEPPDLWQSRVPARLKDRAPHMVNVEGGHAWAIEGVARPINFGWHQCASDPVEESPLVIRWEDCRKGGFDPAARLIDLDLDHVDADVLFPSPPLASPIVHNTSDPELHLACIRAYNDWLSEFCSYSPDRLVGLALMPSIGADAAVEELHRAMRLPGIRGALIYRYPSGGEKPTAADDAFWAAAAEAHAPVSIHIQLAISAEDAARQKKFRFAQAPGTALELILASVFDRSPGLKIVFAEVECGWVPCFKEQADIHWERGLLYRDTKVEHPPSHYIENNIHFTFTNDQFGVANRHAIGLSQLLWAGDYPHTSTTWPHSKEINDRNFKGVPAEEKQLILAGNAARLYGLE